MHVDVIPVSHLIARIDVDTFCSSIYELVENGTAHQGKRGPLLCAATAAPARHEGNLYHDRTGARARRERKHNASRRSGLDQPVRIRADLLLSEPKVAAVLE